MNTVQSREHLHSLRENLQREVSGDAELVRGSCDARDAASRLYSRSDFRRRCAHGRGTPFLGRAYFPRTDPGQFVIDVRMPSGTRLEVSNDYIAKVEPLFAVWCPPTST